LRPQRIFIFIGTAGANVLQRRNDPPGKAVKPLFSDGAVAGNNTVGRGCGGMSAGAAEPYGRAGTAPPKFCA
jgi:hypothetical protein